jgi:hypothetical protein
MLKIEIFTTYTLYLEDTTCYIKRFSLVLNKYLICFNGDDILEITAKSIDNRFLSLLDNRKYRRQKWYTYLCEKLTSISGVALSSIPENLRTFEMYKYFQYYSK